MARSLIPFMFDTGFPTARSFADPFLQLHRDMNRLFDDALRGLESNGGTGFPGIGAPRMNVSETDGEIEVEAELPGVAEQDVRVELTDDVLTIRGEKKATHENKGTKNVHMIERSFGSFSRSIRLPYPVDPGQVHAEFEQGVLTVTLPKSATQEKVHRIEIASGGHKMIGSASPHTSAVESGPPGASGGKPGSGESAARKGIAEGMDKAGGKAA